MKIDDAKITQQGTRFRCPKCAAMICIYQVERYVAMPVLPQNPPPFKEDRQQRLLQSILEELQNIRADMQATRTTPQIISSAIGDSIKEYEQFEQLFIPLSTSPEFSQKIVEKQKEIKEHEQLFILPTAPPEASQKVVEDQKEILINDIEKWFTERQILVRNTTQDQNSRELNKVAKYLGERFAQLRQCYQSIKKNCSNGNTLDMVLPLKTPQEITSSTNFCNLLKSSGLLTKYAYSRKEKTISIAISQQGDVIKFLTGGWFERYIYANVKALFAEYKAAYQGGLNYYITFPEGGNYEIDLFFLVNDYPLLIECKTGSWMECIGKYTSLGKLLAIPKNRLILVILDIPNQQTDTLSNQYEITVANQNNLLDKVREALETPFEQRVLTHALVTWEQFSKTYHEGDILEVTITTIAWMGIFVVLNCNTKIKGLIHRSNLPENYLQSFQSGHVINVKIKAIKPEKQQVEFVLS